MIDATGLKQNDVILADDDYIRLGNIITVVLGELKYKPKLGVDLVGWLQDDTEYTIDQFRDYLLVVLGSYGFQIEKLYCYINNNCLEVEVTLANNMTYIINLGGSNAL